MITIPGKTFLLGEYAALAGYPALLITTYPCFKAQASKQLQQIHPDSPAGKFCRDKNCYLSFEDPYQGLGGLGASTAQFLAAFLCDAEAHKQPLSYSELMASYWEYAWSGEGLKPSGYDLLAQTSKGVVYIDNLSPISLSWNFSNTTFLLIHTQQKLATHHHLKALTKLPETLASLGEVIKDGYRSFLEANDDLLIQAVNEYAGILTDEGLVCESTQHYISQMKYYPGVRAIKGCGAMGADILLLLVETEALAACVQKLGEQHIDVLASQKHLFT